jgi:hypothetical protein
MRLAKNMFQETNSTSSYYWKFGILFLATTIGIFSIWWTMVREDSSDYIVNQIVGAPKQYIIATTTENQYSVSNMLYDFDLILPIDWQVLEYKHPNFVLQSSNKKICEIKSNVLNTKKTNQARLELAKITPTIKTLGNQETKIYQTDLIEKDGNMYANVKISLRNNMIEYLLISNNINSQRCLDGLNKIINSLDIK